MDIISERRYRRIGVVLGIIEKVNEHKKPGKTTIQKLVYLSQVLYKIPLGYRFEPYNYGPYAEELTTDIDNLEYRGLIKVDFDNKGYHIGLTNTPNPDKAQSEKETYIAQISELVDNWGSIKAKDLELYTTFIYIDRMYYQKCEALTKEDLIKIVGKIKSKYKERCEEAFEFLRNRSVFLNNFCVN